jgi:hypothetical protein
MYQLTKRKMTRKHSLGFMGMAALVILNIEPVLKALGKHRGVAGNDTKNDASGSTGYDASTYVGTNQVNLRNSV